MTWGSLQTTVTRTMINASTRQFVPDLSVGGGAISHNPEETTDCRVYFKKEGLAAITNGLLITVHTTLKQTPTVDADYTLFPLLYYEVLPTMPDVFESIPIPIGKLYKMRFGFLALASQTYSAYVEYRKNGVSIG